MLVFLTNELVSKLNFFFVYLFSCYLFHIPFDWKGEEKLILGFHSRDQQPCFLTETKKKICMKIEFNSRRINWGSNMAVVYLFRGSNMAAVTSGENQE